MQVTDVNGIRRTVIQTSENRKVVGSIPPWRPSPAGGGIPQYMPELVLGGELKPRRCRAAKKRQSHVQQSVQTTKEERGLLADRVKRAGNVLARHEVVVKAA